MATPSENPAIRPHSTKAAAVGLALGACVLGAAVAGGGFFLAERQDRALSAQETRHQEDRAQLVDALRQARLTGPQLRLQELAALPLMPDYLQVAAEQPGSLDAQELNAYLTTVLEAALEETGLARMVLQSADGTALIDVARLGVDQQPGLDVLALETPVPTLDGSGEPVGQLIGVLSAQEVALLAPAGEGSPETTASSGAASAENQDNQTQSFRLFALLAGLVTAMVGLIGATLVRRAGS